MRCDSLVCFALVFWVNIIQAETVCDALLGNCGLSASKEPGYDPKQIQKLCDKFFTEANSNPSWLKTIGSAETLLEEAFAYAPLLKNKFKDLTAVTLRILKSVKKSFITSESHRLATRIASLNFAVFKSLTNVENVESELIKPMVERIKEVFLRAEKLLNRFQPTDSQTLKEWVTDRWTHYREDTASQIAKIDADLSQVIEDYKFVLDLEVMDRKWVRTIDEIKDAVCDELSHLLDEFKTGSSRIDDERKLQQLLDKGCGGWRQRSRYLDSNVVDIDQGTVLGEGAHGKVYSGTLYTYTRVAIKLLKSSTADDSEKLRKEIDKMMRMPHANVVKVYGLLMLKDKESTQAIVMERLGNSLQQELRNIQFTTPQKMAFTLDIIAGMSKVHEGELVHSDIKPENILLTENRHHVKIVDFGVSYGLSTIYHDSSHRPGGTVRYMAPEVLAGKSLALSSDVYSFGMLLYELWSGRKAWDMYSEQQIRSNVIAGVRPATFKSLTEEGVPEPIATLIVMCWDQNKVERPTFEAMTAIMKIEDFWESSYSRWPIWMLDRKTGKPIVPRGEPVAKTIACIARPTPDLMTRWSYASLDEGPVGDLEWELNRAASMRMTFMEGGVYADSRKNDGWRLPTVWELHALCQQKDVLDGDLEGGKEKWYWSNSSKYLHMGVEWAVDFNDGSVLAALSIHRYGVRLVRDAGRGEHSHSSLRPCDQLSDHSTD